MNKTLHKIENGKVTNSAVFDTDNMPDWAADWQELPDGVSIGMVNNGGVWERPAPDQATLDAQAADAVRAERDHKLASEVDVIAGNALRWAALTAEQQQAWADYRQALLDVPQQEGFPHNVAWPTKPQ